MKQREQALKMALKNKSEHERRILDTVFLKKNKEALISPITRIVNQSIEEGLFPSVLKGAIITPVFKAGNPRVTSLGNQYPGFGMWLLA